MPKDISSFQQDLVNPGAGKDSELYRALTPLLDLNNIPEAKTKFDQERLEKLKNDLRQGTLGLEYLTGLKNNKVETFYDAHPVQATVSNVLGNSGRIGLGVAGGGTLVNALRQWRNLNKTEGAAKARAGDSEQQAGKKLAPAPNKDGITPPLNEDIQRVFGDAYPAPGDFIGKGKKPTSISNIQGLQKRVDALDSVSGSQARPENEKFLTRLNELVKQLNHEQTSVENKPRIIEQIRNLMRESKGSNEFNALTHYADMQTDLERLKRTGTKMKGGLGYSIGDKILANDKFESFLSKLPAQAQSAIRAIIPSSAQPAEELIRKRIIEQIPNNYSEQMLGKMLGDITNSDLANPTRASDKIYNRSLLGSTGTLKNQNMLNRVLRVAGAPVVMGAGIAGAGLGMNALLKLIQSKVYGKDQINEWKRNALKAKGEFEEANRIK